jgi:hypothetical protein
MDLPGHRGTSPWRASTLHMPHTYSAWLSSSMSPLSYGFSARFYRQARWPGKKCNGETGRHVSLWDGQFWVAFISVRHRSPATKPPGCYRAVAVGPAGRSLRVINPPRTITSQPWPWAFALLQARFDLRIQRRSSEPLGLLWFIPGRHDNTTRDCGTRSYALVLLCTLAST